METETKASAATDGHAHAPAHASHPRHRARSTWWKPALGFAAAFALLGWFGQIGLHSFYYVETDDAFLAGHLHQIAPQIDGRVKEVLVADNQALQAGDILVRLDPLEFELALQKARAALAQTRAQETTTQAASVQADAQFTEAQSRATQAEAQLAQADAMLKLARINLARYEQLFANHGAVTQSELDNARSAARAAEAAQAASRANLAAAQSAIGSAAAAQNSARAQIAAAGAAITVTEAAVGDAERKLGYATIVAPASGRIGNKAVEVGNRVVAGQSLCSLAASELWVVANFKETQLARMRAGQEVELTVDALPGHELRGRVDSLAPASGAQFALLPPDNATGNFNKVVQRMPVKITLGEASRREVGDRLRLGLSVIVNVRVR
jgi:membrane fusion protein (multidrug efflux system)